MRRLILASLLAVPLLAPGCSKKEEGGGEAAKVQIDPKAQAEADSKWTTLCASCHGTGGKGDGAAAASLDPKPRSFSDADWQAKVTDDHLAKIIVEGGPAVGLSALMPPNPDLKDKPAVVQALVQKVRSFK